MQSHRLECSASSATAAPDNSFGGIQAIEIVVDDPTRSETGGEISKPDVTIDDNPVTMTQADTGKWYAYVASDVRDAAATVTLLTDARTLDSPPTPARTGELEALTTIQTFDFTDDSNIDVVFDDETITLHYEEDLDGLATVSTDRAGVPIGGQVHVTISDFRLNLDPTEADVWYMNASSSKATYGTTEGTETIDSNALANTDAATLDADWNAIFGGKGGEFTLADPMAAISDIDVTGDGGVDASDNIVRFEETGANTGVFESQNDDESNIVANGNENDDFTIEYADSDVQVFIEDFDSTLETISDGTWNSGDTITVRLSDENLNTNTLTDQDMELGDDNLPILMFGDPITLATVENITPVGADADPPTTLPLGDRLTIDEDTHVGTLMKSTTFTADDVYTFTVTLSPEQTSRLQDATLGNYIHYSSELKATTNAHTANLAAEPDPLTTLTAVNNGERIIVHGDADGMFNITFATPAEAPDGTPLDTATLDANTALRDAVTAADNAEDTATLKTTITGTENFTPEFRDDVDGIDDGMEVADAKVALRDIALRHIVTHDYAIAADIFTFSNGVNHAIYRALLAETDSASGVFEGTIEYQMLNQRTDANPPTQSDVNGASDELVMILDKDYTGGDAPEVTYDADGPGGDDPANASEDAPTNTGEVSVDASTYRVSDDVTITLVDADLNTDSGAREIYRITDINGTTKPTLASIAIGDLSCADELKDVSLRETASDSGVFEGSFTVPGACGVTMTMNQY